MEKQKALDESTRERGEEKDLRGGPAGPMKKQQKNCETFFNNHEPSSTSQSFVLKAGICRLPVLLISLGEHPLVIVKECFRAPFPEHGLNCAKALQCFIINPDLLTCFLALFPQPQSSHLKNDPLKHLYKVFLCRR